MIRIGIVGCGRILAAHLRGFRMIRDAGVDDFRITALCARRRQDADSYLVRGCGPKQRLPCSSLEGDPLSIGDEYLSDFQPSEPVAIFDNYRSMIQDGPVDAVLDLTTHDLHHLVALEAFRHGKHVMTQKPLAASVRAARKMCDAAKLANVVFSVFECFRFSPESRALEWLFHRGPGGSLQMCLLGYVGLWWAPNQIVANTPWRHNRYVGGGITLDLGVHFFHQMRYVAGQPQWVLGQTAILEPQRFRPNPENGAPEWFACDADDTVFATMGFADGVISNWSASWAGRVAPTLAGQGTVYYGTQARVDGSMLQLEGEAPESLVARYERAAEADELLRRFPYGLKDWFALGQLDWIESIRDGRSPETSGEEGLLDLAASFAILESSTAGRKVHVEEVLSGDLRAYQAPIDAKIGL